MKTFTLLAETPVGGNPKSVVVTLSGALTLPNANELKTQLLSVIRKYNEIHFDIKNPSDMDMGFIQLFIATLKEAAEQNKKITHATVLSDEIKNLLDHSGFSAIFNLESIS